MSHFETALRVVEIQRQLVSGKVAPRQRFNLLAEQRLLWNDQFPGRPFEEIAETAKSAPFMLAA